MKLKEKPTYEKYITIPEFSKLHPDNFAARLKQVKIILLTTLKRYI